MEYKAILFHPDGSFVTDFRNKKTKQEVWEKIKDMGSRWILYPLQFVATDKTIVDTPEELECLKGKRIKTVEKYLKNTWEKNSEEVWEAINRGFPLEDIYK